MIDAFRQVGRRAGAPNGALPPARRRFGLAIGALAGMAASACDGGLPPAAVEVKPPAVTTATVAAKPVTPTLTFTGRIEAVNRVDLVARVTGYLERRLFEEGAEVRQGDLLFVIEKGLYQAEVNQIKAAIARAEATLTLAQIEFGRQETLVRREVAAQARLDEARAKRLEAQADVMRLNANLEKAALDLGYTEIRAPVSGRIGRAAVSIGSSVGPSSGPLATIVQQDPIYVAFPVAQRELLDVRRRAVEAGLDPRAIKVRVRLADGAFYPKSGPLNFIDVQVNPSTDTVLARATIANPNRLLIDGQIVGVVVELGQPQLALFVPQQALQADQAGTFVLVVDQQDKVEVRRVQVGAGRDGEALVTTGLNEGERVIIEGIQKVRPRQTVQANDAGGRS